jgi:hypothetical protein
MPLDPVIANWRTLSRLIEKFMEEDHLGVPASGHCAPLDESIELMTGAMADWARHVIMNGENPVRAADASVKGGLMMAFYLGMYIGHNMPEIKMCNCEEGQDPSKAYLS